jgi:hypothetical protein
MQISCNFFVKEILWKTSKHNNILQQKDIDLIMNLFVRNDFITFLKL